MAHRNPISDGDGTEFPWRRPCLFNASGYRMALTHQCSITRRTFVPARRHADKRGFNLARAKTHGIIIGAVGRACGTKRDMAAWQS